MTEAAIELRDVRFGWRAGETTLQIPQLTIQKGERVFLQGASGSGKTTLLGLIGGVLQPSSGAVEVLGTLLNTLSAGRRDRFRGEHLGFIFQMFNLLPYLSVLENVLLPLRFSSVRHSRVTGQPLPQEAARLVEALGLSDNVLHRSVSELSVGQQQRVAAARALIGRPDILIADEPTSALDADTRSVFLHLLMNECRAHGTTLLFVSHDAALKTLFDRTLNMSELNSARTVQHA